MTTQNTVLTQVQQAIKSTHDDLVSQVTDYKGLIQAYQTNKQASQIIIASLGLTSLKQVLNGNLSGIFSFLEIANNDKLDIRGFKQLLDNIGLKGAIQSNSEKTGYVWRKGFKPSFFTLDILNFLSENGYDENDKVIISNHLFGDLFPYEKPEQEEKTLTSTDAVLRLAATLNKLRKDNGLNLTVAELQQALTLSQYDTVKERKDSIATTNQHVRGLARNVA